MCCDYIYDFSWLLFTVILFILVVVVSIHVVVVFIQVVVVLVHVMAVFILVVVVYIHVVGVYLWYDDYFYYDFLMVVVHCDLSEVWRQRKVRLHQKHQL